MWRGDDSLYSSEWSSKPSNFPPPPASSKETGSSSPKGQLCRQFTIDEIRSATQNFNESLLIGTGGFGNLYKGTIKNGTTTGIVAIKQWNYAFNQGSQEFQAEVQLVSMRRVVDTSLKKEQQGLVRWAQDCVRRGKLKQIIDPELKGQISSTCLNDYVKIVEECLRKSQEQRVTTDELVSGLESILALQERTDHNSIPQKGINVSGRRLDKQFLSYGRNSGGSYFSKVTRLLSAKSLLHKGDHGHTSKLSNPPPLSASSKETGSFSPKGQLICHKFTIAQILSATQDFNKSLLIGKGGFGSVYKGTIKNGTTTTTIVAVKRRKSASSQGVQEFETEVYLLPLRRAIDWNLDEEQVGLVRWAKDCLRLGKLEQIIDPDLKGQISLKCLNDYVRIVECCLRHRQEPRITMAEVLFGLESILALHERTDNSIPQMGITTSDWRLQKYFFSSGENSGGSYFREGREPEKDFNVIWKPYEMTPVRSIRFSGEDSDQASEPDDEVIVQELSSGEETMKSLYELMQLEYIQRAGGLMRMVDFLHLIWFYPMKKEAEVNFGSLLDKFSSFNEYIRKLQDSSRDEGYLMEIQKLLQDIEEDLDDAAFDMVAYLPEGLQVPLASFWSGIPEVHASAIASATQRAISCIKDLKVKKLGTAGSGALEIAEILKDLPELRRAFDMVLYVHVKHDSIEELMNDIEEEIHLWRKRSLETGSKINVLNKFPNCLLFVDCSDTYIDLHDPEFNLSKWFGTVQIVITSGSENAYCPVDIEIRVEDHLLPWILFSTNVDLETVGKYSEIQQMAAQLIEKCNGHLLAIILLARALRGVVDVGVWVLALHELSSLENPSSSSSSLEKPSSYSSSQMGVTNDVMVRVLRFIWSRMESLSQRCIVQFASHYIGSKIKKFSLINSWTKDGLVKGEQEAESVFEDIIRSFLIEQVGGNCVRMRNEIRVILVTYFVESLPRGYGHYPKQDGSEPNKMPNIEESDAWEIHLSNNIISELPNNPNCPLLVNLFLHFNQDLTDIPVTFFDNMPSLQVLDLSSTSINCLPSSISKLTALGKLFIRDCDLLMELPPEIGALKNLKVFDSEGTQLVCLPEQFGSLTKLECLKFSLYKQSNQSMQIILAAVLSKLLRLKELSICVDLYGEWWEDEVKLIINILPKFRKLKSLTLYFPTTELLGIFMETKSWRKVPIYQHLSNFGFIVGHIQQRMISRVPLDLHRTFVKRPKCFTYTNGEEDLEAISMALTDVAALFLDRHWTLQSLSALGLVEMEKLKFCLLSECNEMLQIVNGRHLEDFFVRSVLGSLQHLSIHYMKSLICIWNGPIHSRCLSNLKTLAMHSCPELRTIFTQGLLESLTCLECLIVEDCSMINSLVSLGSYNSTSTRYLPSLKKISLLHLPELVSISRGISIAPRLVSLVVYDCPKLEKLSYMKAFDNDIKEIKGENEWWDALKWCEPEWTRGRPNYLANVFIPLGTNAFFFNTGIKEAGTVQMDSRPCEF
ncbi:unnamed protein product [Lactuca virosa]|uniref:Protein kinase domain-containing protein n=1 Tax=Lactuca virosa TaxID=75947 RepID=A0AAU9P0T5_9ASTR|nr:unnamed protein product [Lactuca virosa]